MGNNRDYSGIFALWFLGVIAWQIIWTKELVDHGGDWTGDGVVTMSDWWSAYGMAWTWPARQLALSLDPQVFRFLELNMFDMPTWFVAPISAIAWTVIWLVPCMVLVALIEMLTAAFTRPKNKV